MPASRSVLHRLIEEAGGTVSTSDLMKSWGLSQTRFREIERHPDFPIPIGTVGAKKQRVYLKDEADEFRHAMKNGALRARR